jgi:hypothetical protein
MMAHAYTLAWSKLMDAYSPEGSLLVASVRSSSGQTTEVAPPDGKRRKQYHAAIRAVICQYERPGVLKFPALA